MTVCVSCSSYRVALAEVLDDDAIGPVLAPVPSRVDVVGVPAVVARGRAVGSLEHVEGHYSNMLCMGNDMRTRMSDRKRRSRRTRTRVHQRKALDLGFVAARFCAHEGDGALHDLPVLLLQKVDPQPNIQERQVQEHERPVVAGRQSARHLREILHG